MKQSVCATQRVAGGSTSPLTAPVMRGIPDNVSKKSSFSFSIEENEPTLKTYFSTSQAQERFASKLSH